MNKVQELIEKYHLKENSYYPELSENDSPYKTITEEERLLCDKRESELQEKWRNHIGQGWYGFSFGSPTPLVWFDVIDEFLDYVKEVCPDFEIYQIKLKYGGLRKYLGRVTGEIQDQIDILENVLCDEKLVY